MRQLFIDAGHDLYNEGAMAGGLKEAQETIKIRDALKKILSNYSVLYVPDTLNIKDTLAYINARSIYEDFAVAIHLNYHNDPSIRGTEAYYDLDPKYAESFSRNIAKSLGIPNRGAKHDSQSAVGSLGFLRKLNCESCVVEVLYLSNPEDREALNYEKAALGIKNALDELFRTSPQSIEEQKVTFLTVLISLYKKLIELLKKQ